MLLQTQQLTKDYGSFRALENLNLSVSPGEIFGLLGPNGSGKSTALRLILGFLRPTLGSASLAGHDCWHAGHLARQQVNYLPGELRLYENMTGRQLIQFLSKLRQKKIPDDIGVWAKRFDIDISRPLSQLSSGMKRKVALLAVLVPRTPLVILDEPTNTLDPTMRDELLDQLQGARNRGQAVLFSSHVLAEVEKVCTRVGILQKGKLVHVQSNLDLKSVKEIEVELEGVVEEIPNLPGLERYFRKENRITFEFKGDFGPLLNWLSRQRVLDLKVHPAGLTRIYQQYHG